MNQSFSKTVFLLIIFGLIILAGGGFMGILYQMGKDNPKLEKYAAIMKGITSKAIPSIIAYGQVTNIKGRDVTLTFEGDFVTINIKQDATVYSFSSQTTPQNGTAAGRQMIEFGDIKIGDVVNISTKISADGRFLGEGVVILQKK